MIQQKNNLKACIILTYIYLYCFITFCHATIVINGEAVNNSDVSFVKTGRFLIYTSEMATAANFPFHSTAPQIVDPNNSTNVKAVMTDSEPLIVDSILQAELKTRKEIYYSMINSSENFSFTTLNKAQEVFKMRIIAMNTIRYFNKTGKFRYLTLNNAAHTHSLYWDKGRNDAPHFFKQTKIINNFPFDAVKDLCRQDQPENITYGECWGALITSIWNGASQTLGFNSFNDLVHTKVDLLDMDPRLRVRINSEINSTSLFCVKSNNFTKLIPGDWVYFKNHNYGEFLEFLKLNYPNKYKEIITQKIFYASGENALYLGLDDSGQKIFSGLLFDQSEYVSETEIKTILINSYNNDLSFFWGNKDSYKLDEFKISRIEMNDTTKIKITERQLPIIPH